MEGADKAVDKIVADIGLGKKPISSKQEELAKKKAELLKLRASTSAPPASSSSDISDSERRLRILESEAVDIEPTGSSSSSTSASRKSEDLLARKKAAEDSLRSISEGKISISPTTAAASSRIKALESEKRKYAKALDDLPSTKDLLEAKATEEKKLDRLQRGIDVCFLMDCTGSMGSFISAAKEKILEIINKVGEIEATAIMRVAFVGYRDYGDGDLQYEKVDFVEKERLDVVRNKLAACPATGGGDGPEDIAGGLKMATELSWYSSTRLMIHYPCHGSKYQSPAMGDSYPLLK